MIRVLVVDDSTFMRHSLTELLEADPEIKVVDTARDGLEAIKKAENPDIDVITLDVEMPKLNGLKTLQQIMQANPLPVIMISSLTEDGAESTLKALEYGAQDFMPKTLSNDKDAFGKELRKKVKAIARRKSIIKLKYHRQHPKTSSPLNHSRAGHSLHRDSKKIDSSANTIVSSGLSARKSIASITKGGRDLIVIGVSTGGPPVVQKILSALPGDLPACILIAQHMPATFTGPFAKRLNSVSQFEVLEATGGEKLKNGFAYVCPGGKHIGVRMNGPLPEVLVSDHPKDALYKPTVNLLMETAGNVMGKRTLGVMLTGMGNDGVDGAKILRDNGGLLIAQNEASCVVYGMPKAVVDANLANLVLDVDDIAGAIVATIKG